MSSIKEIVERVTDSKYYYLNTDFDAELLDKANEISGKIKEQENLIKDACYLINLFEKDLADKYRQLMKMNQRFANPSDILNKARAIIKWNKLKATKKIKDMTEEELSTKPDKTDYHIIEYVAKCFFGNVADNYKPKLTEAFSYGYHSEAVELRFELEGTENIRFEVVIPNSPMPEEATEARAYQYIIRFNEKWKNKDGSYQKDWSNSFEWIVGDFKLDNVRDTFEGYFKENIEKNSIYGIKF